MKIHSQILLKISKITLDKEIQPRSQINEIVVSEYSEAMQTGAQFPPVIVFFDGSQYWLADGFHRIRAKKLIGGRKILTEVVPGTRRDAILYAVGANTMHGLQRTNADKLRLAERSFYDSENDSSPLLNKAANHHRQRRGRNYRPYRK